MECAWSITFFFSIHKYNAGEMTIGDRRKCFFLMFLMRGKMKLGAAGSLMGDEHRGHLSHSLWHFSHPTCRNNHNLIHTSHFAPLLRGDSVIFQISTSSRFDPGERWTLLAANPVRLVYGRIFLSWVLTGISQHMGRTFQIWFYDGLCLNSSYRKL